MGGGPADSIRATNLQNKFKDIQNTLYPQLTYHPLALPKARGDINIDPQTFQILSSAHKLLNASNSAFAKDCWLCLRYGAPTPLALPFTSTSNPASHQSPSCDIALPFLVQPLAFDNVSCFSSPLHNKPHENHLGAISFANCTSITNVSIPMCAPNISVFICGNNYAFTYLPQNWTGVCTLGSLFPDIVLVPGDEPVPIPAFEHIAGHTRRAVQFIPLLVGLGITGAVATGAAGVGHSVVQYHKLSTQLISDVQVLSETIQDLQDQVDSLAAVVLQNRRGLDLLTAEKGGVCLALGEKCCFYANKSGIVRDRVKKLQEDLEKRRRELSSNPLWTGLNGFLPYLLPLLGPLLGLLILVSLGPMLFNKLMAFVRQQIEAIQARPIQVHYTRLEMQGQENPTPTQGKV